MKKKVSNIFLIFLIIVLVGFVIWEVFSGNGSPRDPVMGKGDLIVENIVNITLSNLTILITPTIKNIGRAESAASTTQVFISESETTFPLPTRALSPGESQTLDTISYVQPHGTVYRVIVTADINNDAIEENEDNNQDYRVIYSDYAP